MKKGAKIKQDKLEFYEVQNSDVIASLTLSNHDMDMYQMITCISA